MKHVIKMQKFKTTPGTVVYQAETSPGKPLVPLVKSIYLTKTTLSRPYPENITVTVETK